MSTIEKLLSRERMLRLREAQRCHREADELRRAAWSLQHRRRGELLEDVLGS